MRPICPSGSGGRISLRVDSVDHRELAHAIDVRHPGEIAAVVAACEAFDVPGYVRRQYLYRAAAEIYPPQLLELAVAVGDEVDAAALGREQAPATRSPARCLR